MRMHACEMQKQSLVPPIQNVLERHVAIARPQKRNTPVHTMESAFPAKITSSGTSSRSSRGPTTTPTKTSYRPSVQCCRRTQTASRACGSGSWRPTAVTRCSKIATGRIPSENHTKKYDLRAGSWEDGVRIIVMTDNYHEDCEHYSRWRALVFFQL